MQTYNQKTQKAFIMVITFYEKPGCGGNARQKAALAGLGHMLDVKNLLAAQWDKEELRGYFGAKPVEEWFNYTAPAVKNGSIEPSKMSEEGALEAMMADPLLIKRPLMRIGERKISGFDPKEIETVFGFSVEGAATCTKEDKCLEPSLAIWLESKGFATTDVNAKYKNGDTPLITAAREGLEDVVKELLKAGADVNAKNDDQTNAVWAACFANSPRLVELLADSSANVNNQNVNGATALIYASSAGKEEIVKTLLSKGADKTLATLDGFTAFELASTKNILDALRG